MLDESREIKTLSGDIPNRLSEMKGSLDLHV